MDWYLHRLVTTMNYRYVNLITEIKYMMENFSPICYFLYEIGTLFSDYSMTRAMLDSNILLKLTTKHLK